MTTILMRLLTKDDSVEHHHHLSLVFNIDFKFTRCALFWLVETQIFKSSSIRVMLYNEINGQIGNY